MAAFAGPTVRIRLPPPANPIVPEPSRVGCTGPLCRLLANAPTIMIAAVTPDAQARIVRIPPFLDRQLTRLTCPSRPLCGLTASAAIPPWWAQ
jgi:hypothetical protein